MSDSDIRNAVDDELIDDPAVPAAAIDIAAHEGIVTLTGSVDNILSKDRAHQLAATVKGVRGIVNRLEVSAPFKPDTKIREDVEEALLYDRTTESWQVQTDVSYGVVTLTGTVDSWQERDIAAKLAKGVAGVRGLQNEIKVEYQMSRKDPEIRQDVKSALRWDAYIDDALIDVAVKDATVTLSGTVGSVAEKDRAITKARVIGVNSVQADNLEVEQWARDERFRKGKYVDATDKEIRKAVKDAFSYDPRVNAFEIDVSLRNGKATLRGIVDNHKAKRAAAQDARGVVGVWGVDNRIKVRPQRPSDSRIETKVERAMLRDPYVDRHEIQVKVVDGDVYLYGQVDSTFERLQADDLASRPTGVRSVKNFLKVNTPSIATYSPYSDDYYAYDYDWYTTDGLIIKKPDWQIKADIENQLWWSPFVNSDEVNVEVAEGVAHLTGTVDTWSERQAATENAFEGGSIGVNNDLVFSFGPDS